jgi:hypothetical protein
MLSLPADYEIVGLVNEALFATNRTQRRMKHDYEGSSHGVLPQNAWTD